MDHSILNTENQKFITENLNSDIASLLLKSTSNHSVDKKVLIEQIEAKKRCKKKLPTWFYTNDIYYPNKLNIEQTSSEITAQFKANLITGDSIMDLTGGFGVDCFYFSKAFENVTHCEINEDLSQIVSHNFKQLKIDNVRCIAKDGLDVLKQEDNTYDFIYIDPSRRSDLKGKVFLLNDCLPNVPEHLELLFKHSKSIMIKTSPLLDISIGIKELKNVKTIHSIAVNNEVKELLWLLERDYKGEVYIKTTNLSKDNIQSFDFELSEEPETIPKYSSPLNYLYEPNAAILKVGAFNSISKKLKVLKLHKHSHLYTSTDLLEFPGRHFKIESILPYNKKHFKRTTNIGKANITTRNFPDSVEQVRKKLSLKDGGKDYLFCTTISSDKKVVIICSKVD